MFYGLFALVLGPDSEQITNVETLAAKPRGWDLFQFTELSKDK